MAYAYGTAANPDALLEALKDFLLANGWTINRWDDISHTYFTSTINSPLGKQLCVQKNNADGEAMYFNLRSGINCYVFGSLDNTSTKSDGTHYNGTLSGLALSGSTGYDAGLAWDKQPGYSPANSSKSWGACMAGMYSSCNYWLAQNGDTVIVIAEVDTDKFTMLTFGTLKKQGVMAGSGMFFSGTQSGYDPAYNYYSGDAIIFDYMTYRASGGLYVSGIDGHTRWQTLNSAYRGSNYTSPEYTEYARGTLLNPARSTSRQGTLIEFIIQGSPNTFSSITPMWPIYHILKRTGGDIWSLVGVPDGVRAINISALNSKSEITIGTDTWKVFPLFSKTGITYTEGVPGIAVLIS